MNTFCNDKLIYKGKIMSNVIFKIIKHDTPEYKTAVGLREEILRKPLGLAFLPEELEKEKHHINIAGFRGDEIVATAVLVPEGTACKMQRVVVHSDIQSKNIGSQMMTFCEEYVRAQGFESIYCHARDSAVNFYIKNNYVAEGDYFDEDTIPHLKMRKIIAFDFLKSTKDEQEFLDNSLGDYNIEQVTPTQKNHLVLFNYCFKKNGVIIAGINADMYFWHILFVSILFVDKAHRHKNLGSYLLKKVETEAKAMGAKLAHTDTFDFQAKDFYLKHGFEIFGVLDDCPEGHKRYYLKKSL